ncbi:hypothetical protein B0A49_11190 [Cryomyces minteri]|uniref:Major facilitator superfamily (MFS) profile domain-containing protein n=1 Tax=Cryomyces minteri TaxID=331657 RepID=A0A4U0VZE0_9PEZI|nr:hypothetical protein B0A49_11190 [Cryomyces minteri]
MPYGRRRGRLGGASTGERGAAAAAAAAAAGARREGLFFSFPSLAFGRVCLGPGGGGGGGGGSCSVGVCVGGLLGLAFLSELGYIALLYSRPDYARSIGLSAQQGSVIGAVLNLGLGLGLGVGRPVVGYFSDTAGRINSAMLGTAVCGLLRFVVWLFAKSYGVLLLFAVLAGTVCGAFWSTIAPVGAEVVGLKELPSTPSMLWSVLVLLSTCKSNVSSLVLSVLLC